MKIKKDLVAASATPIILSILRDGESYGYAIIQRVRELSDGELVWTDGMLYPILHRMEEQGLIEARWGESDTGRKRKYYRIQNSAQEVLEAERRQWNLVNLILARLAQPEVA
ncbi:MAG: helix-turn-helix transcriptional regulator [Verrucomicrobiales bacterium]|nr:helix-turn-helix transcriptional regulator [Verrucomicrobiales bacterium]